MEKIAINRRVSWIHLESPNEDDIHELKKMLRIHPLILEELKTPSDRSKLENFTDHFFVVFHLPVYDTNSKTSRKAEIDFIAAKNRLITVTYEPLEAVAAFKKTITDGITKKIKDETYLLYYILKEINTFSLRQLRHVERKVDAVGAELFRKQSHPLLQEISYIKRDLLTFSIIAASENNMLESLLELGQKFRGEKMKIYFSDLYGEFLKVYHLLESLKATVESYSETVSQIFQFRTSEIIRRFSILGFLTFPLILYATITLNPRVEPTFISHPRDFWLIFGIIALAIVGLALYFKKKDWL